jgi:hypothetical protein
MRLLTKEEVNDILCEASKGFRLHYWPNYRWGQAIYSHLPKDIAEAINGTDKDMFYTRDEDLATTMLLNLAEKM